MESNKGIKSYLYQSFLTNIPLAIIYTIFGHSIVNFSPTNIIILLLSFAVLLFLLRDRSNVVPWKEFFHSKQRG